MSRRGRSRAAFSLFAFQDIITSVTGIMVLITLILAVELLTRSENAPAKASERIIEEVEQTYAQIESAAAENEAMIEKLKARLQKGQQDVNDMSQYDSSEIAQKLKDAQAVGDQLRRENSKLQTEMKRAKDRQREIESKWENISSDKPIRDIETETAKKAEQLEKLRKNNMRIFKPAKGESRQAWIVEVSNGRILVAQYGKQGKPQQFSSSGAFRSWANNRSNKSDYFVVLVKSDGVPLYDEIFPWMRYEKRFGVITDLLSMDQSAIDPNLGVMGK